MKRRTSLFVIVSMFISMAILPVTPVLILPAHAQTVGLPSVPTLPAPPPSVPTLPAPSTPTPLEIQPPVLRTIDDMLASQAGALPPSGVSVEIPFRPTIDP